MKPAPALWAVALCAALCARAWPAQLGRAEAAAWSGVLGAAVEAQPASPELASMLSRARLDLAMHPESDAGAAFLDRLPGGVSAQAFAAWPADERLSALEAAFAAERAELDAEATKLLAQRERRGGLSAGQRENLRALERRWYYLSPDKAREVREAAAAELGEKAGQTARALIDSELERAFEAVDAARTSNPPRESLAPLAKNAVAFAAETLERRGVPSWKTHEAILRDHARVFERRPPRALVDALSAAGGWTELVASVTLASARALTEAGAPRAARILTDAAHDEALRLPMPPGDPDGAAHATVADALAARAGAPPHPGRRLGSIRGVPIATTIPASTLFLWGLSYQFFWDRLTPVFSADFLLHSAVFGAALVAAELFHDAVQAAAHRLLGGRVRAVVVTALGTRSLLSRLKGRPWADFATTAAGPLANLALAAALFGAAEAFAAAAWVLTSVAQVNVSLFLFNLILAPRLDGGRLVRDALLAWGRDEASAWRLAARAGMAFAAAAAAAGAAWALWLDPVRGAMIALSGGLAFLYSWRLRFHSGAETVDSGN